jgi:MerR HTH family regulatory protein
MQRLQCRDVRWQMRQATRGGGMAMYYTKKEAVEKLGIPESTFFYWVKDGRIRSYLPPHRKRGALYDKEQVDAIAAIQVATGQKMPDEERLLFGHSSEVDLAQEVAIGLDLYGADDIVPLHKLRQWWERNPEMFLCLKRPDGVMVGYSSVTPMQHETIMRLLRDEIREADVDPQDIYPYSTTMPLECYVASLSVVPGPNQRRYATQLIFHVARFIQELGRRRVDITAFYAIGASDDGRRIARRLGFEETYTSPDGERSGFVLHTDNPRSKLAQYYRAGVASRIHN